MMKGIQEIVKYGPAAYLANFNVCHSAFYKIKVDILQYYALLKGIEMTEDELRKLPVYALDDRQRRDLESYLKGLKLKTKELNVQGFDPRYTKKFIGVFHQDSTNYVITHDGQTMNVVDYYWTRFHYRIKYPRMPILLFGSQNRQTCYPIEVLQVSDSWIRIRQLLPDYEQALCTQFTVLRPEHRFKDIQRMVRDVKFGGGREMQDEFMENFGIVLSPNMLQIEGRVLPDVPLQDVLGKLEQFKMNPKMKPIVFSVFAIGRFSDNDYQIIRDNVTKVVQGCKVRQLPVIDRSLESANLVDVDDHEQIQRIAQVRNGIKSSVPNATYVPIFVVSSSCTAYGVCSQVLRFDTLKKKVGDQRNPRNADPKFNATVGNIVRKISVKTGGINIKIGPSSQIWKKFTDSPTLFLGADVTHPAPGENDLPSIAALVGNKDVDAIKYGASIRLQPRERQGKKVAEESINLDTMHMSESWLSVMKDNLAPGTVIDRFITHPPVETLPFDGPPSNEAPECTKPKNRCEKEFYLCSHQGLLGTSRPCRYHVIYDELELSADDVEQLSYASCHAYALTVKPMSIPAPVYWAHKACYRARKHYAVKQAVKSIKTWKTKCTFVDRYYVYFVDIV